MTNIDAAALLNRTFSDPQAASRRAMQQSFDTMRRGIPPPGASPQKINAAGSPIVRRHRAFRLTRHNQVEQIFVDEWRGQKFAEYATEWERAHSAILVGGSVRPLVDDNGTVVGHVGIFRGDQIFVQGEESSFFQRLDVVFKNALVIADKRYDGKQLRHYTSWRSTSYASVVTDPDGFVLQVINTQDRDGVEPSSFNPVDLILVTLTVGRLVIIGLSRRAAGFLAGRRIGSTRGVRSLPEAPVLARLRTTAADLQSHKPIRTLEVLSSSRVYRHTLTGDVPPVSFARIEMEGSLRFSTGANAHYGEGVYAWPAGSKGVRTYIDIEVPAGTGVETLDVGGSRWVRLMPPSGDKLPVKIVGTNMSSEQIAFGRRVVNLP